MQKHRHLVMVWSSRIRVFHWLNVLCILGLIILGSIILNSKLLGISTDGKILLKTIHVCIGYVFAFNLLLRIMIGLVGKGLEKFSQTLPFTKQFFADVKQYKADNNTVYKGHNPLGKLMVAALLLLMSVQAVTGLVIAGTDIYYPPFGQYFAESIAIDKSQLALIQPYSKANVNEQAYQAMRDVRSPFITLHVYAFYGLLLLIPLHILGVVFAERKQKSALTSAMITGYKSLPNKD